MELIMLIIFMLRSGDLRPTRFHGDRCGTHNAHHMKAEVQGLESHQVSNGSKINQNLLELFKTYFTTKNLHGINGDNAE
jgi:hypothetical protein